MKISTLIEVLQQALIDIGDVGSDYEREDIAIKITVAQAPSGEKRLQSIGCHEILTYTRFMEDSKTLIEVEKKVK